MDETLAAFLAHDELLGNAVLFFFREKIREDKRVEASLAALQREGLLAEVSNLQEGQKQGFDTIDAKLKMLFEEFLKIQRQFCRQLVISVKQNLWNNKYDQLTSCS